MEDITNNFSFYINMDGELTATIGIAIALYHFIQKELPAIEVLEEHTIKNKII